MRGLLSLFLLSGLLFLGSCGGFQATRVDTSEGDEKALTITDQWVEGDTTRAIADVVKQMENHAQFKSYVRTLGRAPKVFVGEVQNDTSEAYFPIEDMNDEFLNLLSASGDFQLVDAAARGKVLEELTYQHDGMVDPATAKQIGKQLGADLMIFGAVRMRPHTRSGKTIKQYTVNIRMTDIEKGVEVLRVRTGIQKFSKK